MPQPIPHTLPHAEPTGEPNGELLTLSPHISVRFPVHGRTLPADHGYALHAAVTSVLPAIHAAPRLGLELISGIPWREGIIALPTRGGAFHLRLPAYAYAEVLPLAGKRLDIAGHIITLGIPAARPFTPASSLYARMVTIKKFTEPEPFLEAAQRQLDTHNITATLELPHDGQGRFRRRILSIKNNKIVGFSVAVHELSDDDSVLLQSLGIGGRRAMGCGIFNPVINSNTK